MCFECGSLLWRTRAALPWQFKTRHSYELCLSTAKMIPMEYILVGKKGSGYV